MAVFLLIPLGWGILLGLVLSQLLAMRVIVVISVLIVSLMLASLAMFRRKPSLFRISIVALGFSLGAMVWQNSQVENQYEKISGASIDMQGKVMSQPTITSSGNQALVVRPDGFSQSLRASLFHHTYVSVGDQIWIRGQLKQPENFDEFNYIQYLKQQNIYGELSQARIIVINPSQASVATSLNRSRKFVIRRAERLFNEQSAAIVLGMLIGEKEQLPNNLQESFRKVGLVHILVVSGFNLTIIAMSIGVFARLIGRRLADFASLGIIWLFVMLVGASGAVTRAGVMASLLIGARLSGRLAMSSVSLLVAVVVMTLINPWRLFYDIGFQLSIVATFGVLEANQLRLSFEKDGWFSELSWASLGAIIMTAPIVAYYFGTFSVVAPLANLLILPSVPYLMLFGALGLLPSLELIFVPITELLIDLQLKLINGLANFPFSQVEVRSDLEMVIGYYIFIFTTLSIIKFHRKSRLKESVNRAKMTKITI